MGVGKTVASIAAAVCTVIGFAYDWGMSGAPTRRSLGTFGASWVGLSPAADTITAIGDTAHLAATVTDKHGAALVGISINWSVDHPNVASVGADGTVIAHAPGSATVVVTVGNLVARSSVVVRPVAAAVHVASDSAIALSEGTARVVSARATDARGHVLSARPIRWRSADTTIVATDSTGALVGVSAGHATVTATIDGVSADAPVTVVAVPGTLVAVGGGGQHAAAGAPLSQPIIVKLLSRRGHPVAGQSVHFRRADVVNAGDIGTSTTDADGRARFQWRLSDLPGRQHAIAAVDGLDSVLTIEAEAEPVNANTRAIALADTQTTRAGSALALPTGVRLTDTTGRLLSDVPVTWLALDGGTVTGTAPRTDSLGEAHAAWVLGPRAGRQRLRALIGDGRAVRPVTFHATALAGPAAALTVAAGDNQKGKPSAALSSPLVFRVTDAAGNAVAGVRLTLTAVAGAVADSAVVTDSLGRARTHWTLGATAGAQHVTAQAAGIAQPVTLTATAIAPPVVHARATRSRAHHGN